MRGLISIVFVVSLLVIASTAVLFWQTRETAMEILRGRALDRASAFVRSANAPNVDDGVLDYLSAGLVDHMVKSACIYSPRGEQLGKHSGACSAPSYKMAMVRRVVESGQFVDSMADDGLYELWFPLVVGGVQAENRNVTHMGPGPKVEERRILLLRMDPSSVNDLIVQIGIHMVLITLLVALLMAVTVRQVRLFMREKRLEKELNEQRRFADLGRLSAVLAHEIRNPLGAIKGFAQYSMEQLDPGDQRRGDMETIVDESLRLERLTQSLLLYAKPTAPVFTSWDLGEYVPKVIKLISLTAEKNAVALEVDIRQPGIVVKIDEEQMKQALLNILGNALEAMMDGGTLKLSVVKEGESAILQIADTGVGIEPSILPDIFEPYVTSKSNGTGLGLSVTRRIIRAHGGVVGVSSVPGKGTVFTIVLPSEVTS
jgi:two-component system sensor histidine kinase HydH